MNTQEIIFLLEKYTVLKGKTPENIQRLQRLCEVINKLALTASTDEIDDKFIKDIYKDLAKRQTLYKAFETMIDKLKNDDAFKAHSEDYIREQFKQI